MLQSNDHKITATKTLGNDVFFLNSTRNDDECLPVCHVQAD